MRNLTLPALISLSLLMAASSFAQQSQIETQAMRIRNAQGKQIVKCSPDGGGEWLAPMSALQKAKRGDVLRMAPGVYPTLTIDVDGLIIEGDPDQNPGTTTISLNLKADGCSIRNLRVQHLDIERDANIVDSVVSYVYFSPDWSLRKKHKVFFANSIIGKTRFYTNDHDIQMDFYKCTIYNSESSAGGDCGDALIDMNGKMNLSIEKCVLYGNKCLVIDGDWGGKVRMNIDTCLLYGIDSIAREENDCGGRGRSRGSTDVARTLKDIRKVCAGTVNIKGQCFVEKPQFVKQVDFSSVCYSTSSCGRGGAVSRSYAAPVVDFSGLALAPGSPGADQGIGVSFNEKKFPGVSAAEIAAASSGKKPAAGAPSALPASIPKAPEKKDVAGKTPAKPADKPSGKADSDKELMDVMNK